MPFIWNDDKHLFLHDDEPYDRSEYVVVRKLYVNFVAPTNVRSNSVLHEKSNFRDHLSTSTSF